jgi:hypothetical protein
MLRYAVLPLTVEVKKTFGPKKIPLPDGRNRLFVATWLKGNNGDPSAKDPDPVGERVFPLNPIPLL